MALIPDERFLAAVSGDDFIVTKNCLQVWAGTTASSAKCGMKNTKPVTTALRLVVRIDTWRSQRRRTLKVFENWQTSKRNALPLFSHGEDVHDLVFSSDESLVAAAGWTWVRTMRSTRYECPFRFETSSTIVCMMRG